MSQQPVATRLTPPHRPTSRHHERSGNMPKILVIEENMLLRNMIARLLGSSHDVIGAEDARLGLQLLQRENPALVAVDIGVPERHGIVTIREIRTLCPEAKILAIATIERGTSLGLGQMAASLGACEIIAKPFAPAELVAAATRCLDGAPGHRPARFYAGGAR